MKKIICLFCLFFVIFLMGCTTFTTLISDEKIITFTLDNFSDAEIKDLYAEATTDGFFGGRIKLKMEYNPITKEGIIKSNSRCTTLIIYFTTYTSDSAGWYRVNANKDHMELSIFEDSNRLYLGPIEEYQKKLQRLERIEKEKELERTVGREQNFIIIVINETNREFFASPLKEPNQKYPVTQYNMAQIYTSYLVKNGLAETSGVIITVDDEKYEIPLNTIRKQDLTTVYIRGFALDGTIYFAIK